ncbi:L-rhamnose mutarotase [Flavobacterium glycines]|uniref:L-fucose mutarotase n=1 Tax=Flavobacterium glycines TaxID=551990 RepID=A0A1B9DZB0_9FLAO|nr:L-rhamnose mutarotase [Flavobacterium glycines]OCB75008.1 L-fucose mutarotase [Flavobacterium glycines]GEL11302.1 L-fucose mutarotase [Flavobacterium glycines]SDJ42631.1 L-rhamnose mutarotase [Flavobacterium glycines]
MKKYCLALDLKNDSDLIEEYKRFHQNVWPEILESIKESGIKNLEIYNIQDRLFMIIEADTHFSFEEKSKLDASNPKVQEWEDLMWKFQQALPGAKPVEKWLLMDKIFEFK